MASDYLSSISNFDLESLMYGSDRPAPLPDVSWSSPAMESSTPTGTGSGVFMDSSLQNALLGGLDKALNWAIARDTAKINQQTQNQLAGTQAGSVNTMLAYQAQSAAANRKLILIGAAVAALFLVMRK